MSEMQRVEVGGRQCRKSFSQQIAEACNLTQEEERAAELYALYYSVSIEDAEKAIQALKQGRVQKANEIVEPKIHLDPFPMIQKDIVPVYNRAERRKKIGNSPKYTQRKRGRKKK